MITVKIGNLFESSASTWVNTVNCVGVMGKGIALEFKKRFPAMFKDYVKRCEAGQVQLGRPYHFWFFGHPGGTPICRGDVEWQIFSKTE